MREDVADVDDSPSVLDRRDEPELISADVKNRENVRCIWVRKVGAHSDQMPPGSSLGYAVPVQQRLHRVSVRFAEFSDCRFTDDPHISGYQNGNHRARGKGCTHISWSPHTRTEASAEMRLSAFRIPPLIISEADLAWAVGQLHKAFEA